MKGKFSHITSEKPFFLFLLPIFFVWHNYVDFYDLISPSKALLLILYYLIGTIIVFVLSKLVLQSNFKAALYSFFIMCLYFFFGSLQDFLQKKFPGSIVNKYSFLLSALLLLFILVFIIIKRNKGRLTKAFSYLNALILLLILFDLGLFFKKNISGTNILTIHRPFELKTCDTCAKPDIYLILADGYSGKIALKKFFGYDNSAFESELKKRKFFIVDSSISNYNYTLFSMGSMFNLDYLNASSSFEGKKDFPIAFRAIRKSRLLKFLENEQYEIYNYSIFDLEDHPSLVQKTLMNFDKNPISTQTFLYRLKKDIGYHLITNLHLNFLQEEEQNNLFDNLDNNLKIDSLTKNIASTKSTKPKFIYTHLVMPHWPYYFDSSGNKASVFKLTDAYNFDKPSYVSYLKYTNKKLLELIDHIQSTNSRPAVILLMSDHGFRENENLKNDTEYTSKFQFLNLNAASFPDQNYNGFYRGMSNVNQFRVVLNSQFDQHLELLKDSVTIFKY